MPTKQSTPPPAEKRIPVLLRGDHPHVGRVGFILSVNGKIETINLFGTGMIKIYFDDGEACYAEQKHIAEIHVTSAPTPKKK